MDHINKRFLVLIPILLVGLQLLAQDEQWEREGEIKDVEIEIVRERQITLPRANRNFEKVPPRPSEPITPEITYEFRNLNFNVPEYRASIRPLRLKQEEIARIYGRYVSVGYGNFSSPFLDAWLNTKRDKEKFVGARLYHRSFGKGPVDDKNSASSNSEISVFGSSFMGKVTSTGSIDYVNRGGYFYGYAPGLEVARDSIRQSYHTFNIGGSFSNTKPSDFNYDLGGSFGYLSDHYNAAESEVGLNFKSDYAFSDNKRMILNSEYYLITRKDSLIDAKPRHLLKINPTFRFMPIENLSVSIGANAVLENDTIRNKSLHVYPDVAAEYTLSKNINAYARLSGDMDKVTLRSTSSENFWVNANVNIFHTNKTFDFTAGLRGKLGKQASFNLGVAAANLQDLYFYQNLSDRAKFDLVYDNGNVQRVNFFGELGFNKNEVVKLGVRGDYFSYNMDKQPEAWHRPTYRFSANSSFNIYEKLLLKVSLVGQGGMKALNSEMVPAQVVTLDTGVDLNIKADYYLSRQASIFLKFENILSNEYPVYLNYPVRGIQVLGGVSWSF